MEDKIIGAEFAQRLRRMEDVEEIKKLKARYCDACDGGWDGRESHEVEKIVGSFTEDGVWEGGVYGRRVGRDALREYYRGTTVPPFAYHLLTNPVIEVDGDRATGSWHLTIFFIQEGGVAMMVGGVFDDDYARTGEGWRISRSRFSLALHGEYRGILPPGGPAQLFWGSDGPRDQA